LFAGLAALALRRGGNLNHEEQDREWPRPAYSISYCRESPGFTTVRDGKSCINVEGSAEIDE
jgi:hypothetical protein